jgi:hypothetical protein
MNSLNTTATVVGIISGIITIISTIAAAFSRM